MFRNDWSIKPNGEAYKQLVFDDWWTREKIRADTNGSASVRGFLGTYSITVTHNGRTAVQTVQLNRPGTAVTIDVDDQGTCGTPFAGGQREHNVTRMTAFPDSRATKRKEDC